jgi:microcystin-dependent protein
VAKIDPEELRKVLIKVLDDPEIANILHRMADVDKHTDALHHTLGKHRNQAARGDHLHDLSKVVPVGTVVMSAAAVTPENYLACDGSSLLRSDYPDLFDALGTTYGAVDGTHFTLPDFTNKVPRGQTPSTGGGADTHQHNSVSAGIPSGTIGNTGDTASVHFHTFSSLSGSAGAHTHSVPTSNHDHGGSTGSPSNTVTVQSGTGNSPATGGHTHSISNSEHDHGGHVGVEPNHAHGIANSDANGNAHHHSGGLFSGDIMGTHQHNSQDNIPAYVGVKFIIKAV